MERAPNALSNHPLSSPSQQRSLRCYHTLLTPSAISKELRQGTTASSKTKGKTLKSLSFMAVMNEDRESPCAGLLDSFLTFC